MKSVPCEKTASILPILSPGRSPAAKPVRSRSCGSWTSSGIRKETGAEYADCYNVGIDPEIWKAAGFRERTSDDPSVIPNYLTPPLYENTEYYYFTNKPEGFVLFKADGDQDRPNLS